MSDLPHGKSTTSIEALASIIIIGANGSGKTRLGAWIEFGPQHKLVHRIGAQRHLQFPSAVNPAALIDAETSLVYGVELPTSFSFKEGNHLKQLLSQTEYTKRHSKWSKEPETGMLYDYKKLLIYLFSEHYDVITNYVNRVKETGIHSALPETKIDIVKRIWEQVLPHRELVIKASDVSVKLRDAPDGSTYAPSAMSDGERVTFYLIGQAIAAPTDSLIIIDEPELHLHRSVQVRLWEEVERERQDCLFVYLTHDLEFAASRSEAKKIWLKSYNGKVWDWAEVPDSEGMPEEMLLSVLGSRKPVLFTEGDRGGSEQAIFSRIYPGWTIMPCGNCEQVIESTKAFTALKHLHSNECCGIIDRDYRTDQEVADLWAKGIHVLAVQEVENQLLVEDVLTAVVAHALEAGTITGTAAAKVAEIKSFLFQLLAQDQQLLTSRRAGWEIEKTLRKFDAKAVGLPALQAAVQATAALDVASIYATINAEFTRILTEQDYPTLLKLYNNKGLAKQAGRFFGIQVAYPEFVKRLISGSKGEPIVAALRAACPLLSMMHTPTTIAA
jgi:energy-coupling factor transporter ATP-binding protein EcfA2